MTPPSPSSETLHVSAVAIGGRGVLIGGLPGAGKSDLALRLIDRGAVLISDDYTHVRRERDRAIASAPATIRGKMEVRGLGIVERESVDDVPVALFVDLDAVPERLPEPDRIRVVAGIAVPLVALAAHEGSAPVKVETALALFGLPE